MKLKPNEFVICLNDDGTVDLDYERMSDWCRAHRRGIVFSIGREDDERLQNVHVMERQEVMAGKQMVMEAKAAEVSPQGAPLVEGGQ